MKTFFARRSRWISLIVSVFLLRQLFHVTRCLCGHQRRIHRYGGRGWNQMGQSWLLKTCPSPGCRCVWLSKMELKQRGLKLRKPGVAEMHFSITDREGRDRGHFPASWLDKKAQQ